MSCAICFNDYNTEYIPIVLTCRHTFCKICINQLDKNIICLICKHLNYSNELIVNYAVLEILDSKEDKNKNSIMIKENKIITVKENETLSDFLQKTHVKSIANIINDIYYDKYRYAFLDAVNPTYSEILHSYIISYTNIDNKIDLLKLLENNIIEGICNKKIFINYKETISSCNILSMTLVWNELNPVSKYLIDSGITVKNIKGLSAIDICQKSKNTNTEMIDYILSKECNH